MDALDPPGRFDWNQPMTAGVLAAFLLVVPAGARSADHPSTLESAEAAIEAGRLDDARALYEGALAVDRSYDALVGLGVVLGRQGKTDGAAQILSEAIDLDRGRPEAWIERGGVHFLERRYQRAVDDLQSALDREEDPYARDLLATSLHLAGRPIEALREWNHLGQPTLRQLNLIGLRYTRADLVRSEILPTEGRLLMARDVRETRLRLAELGVFARVTLRAQPVGNGVADLDVAVADRRGFGQSWIDVVGVTGVNLLARRLQGRYTNLLGMGMSVGARWRWEENRPEATVQLDWARPFGHPGRLQLAGRRARQRFVVPDEIDESVRMIGLQYRRVLSDRTVGALAFDLSHRSYSRVHAQALPGWATGVGAELETRLLDTYRNRIDLQTSGKIATSASGAASFGRGMASLSHRVALGPAEELRLERTVIAWRLAAGALSRSVPIGEWLVPGSSPDLEWPLRAYPQARRGVLGGMPLTRRLVMANIEWRQRLIRGALGEVGLVPFFDAAWLGGDTYSDDSRVPTMRFLNVGIGLRIGLPGGALLRGDVGFGLSDRSRAFTLGLGQAF